MYTCKADMKADDMIDTHSKEDDALLETFQVSR